MRAPFLPSGSLAIWTMISWPCFSMSEMSCGAARRRAVAMAMASAMAHAAVGDHGRDVRRDRDGHRGRVLRDGRGAACASGNRSGRARSRAAFPVAADFRTWPGSCFRVIRLLRRHDLKIRATRRRLPSQLVGLRLRHALQRGPRRLRRRGRIRGRRLRDLVCLSSRSCSSMSITVSSTSTTSSDS